MKISIINGSPKAIKSNSEILGNYLSSLFKENEIKKYYSISFRLNDENKNEIYKFPAYMISASEVKEIELKKFYLPS